MESYMNLTNIFSEKISQKIYRYFFRDFKVQECKKSTLWCVLSFGGVIGFNFFKSDNSDTFIVNLER